MVTLVLFMLPVVDQFCSAVAKMPDVMLEMQNLKDGCKSQKQTIKEIIKYPECCALELPSFKSPKHRAVGVGEAQQFFT